MKCSYCHFAIDPGAPDAARQERYVAALRTEIDGTAAGLRGDAALVSDSLYFGGGTPSLLASPLLAGLMEALRREFGLVEPAEITLEANPADLSVDDLCERRRLGCNRLSLGVQSFDDAVLEAMRRPHSAVASREAMAAARRAGFEDVSIDLVLGWPGESAARWERTLDEALGLAPEHVSLYVLEVEPKTALRHDVVHGRAALPEDDLVADLYELSVERLAENGLARYEISNFARPGRESRHNLKYWTGAPFLGFGMSAHGCHAGRRYWNEPGFARYVRGVEAAGAMGARAGERVLSPREAAQEAMFTGLRLDAGVSRAEFAARHGAALLAELETALTPARDAGLVRCAADRWSLTERGVLVSNEVFAALV